LVCFYIGILFLKNLEDNQKELRKYIRINTVFPVELKVVNKDTGKSLTKNIQCTTKDVSKNGLCLVFSSDSEILAFLKQSNKYKFSISINIPFSSNPIAAYSNIIWHKIVEQGMNSKLLIGVEYESILGKDKKRLYSYAKSKKRTPYELAILIFLLIIFGLSSYYHYYISNNKNIVLTENFRKLKNESIDIEQQILILKGKDIEIKNKIDEYKEKIKEKQEQMSKLVQNLQKESVRKLIQGLKQENELYKENIVNLSKERIASKNKLDDYEKQKLYLDINNAKALYKVDTNKDISVITLNNNSNIIGEIIERTDIKIIIKLQDSKKIDVHLDEIKNILYLNLTNKGIDSSKKTKTIIEQTETEFLQKIEYDTFRYFLNEVNVSNGLVKDISEIKSACNISAVGFALCAYSIAESKKWMSYEDAYNLTLKTLKTFDEILDNEHGFFYHFVDMNTGKRVWNSEISCFDTAVFISGALFAGQYFIDTEVSVLAKKLYDRIDWQWMTNNTDLLSIGWKPETEFMPYFWDTYNEGMLAYILAIGSDTHPISPKAWNLWERPKGKYKDYELIYSKDGSLVAYQYPQIWIDFKNLYDKKINYRENLIKAIYSNREFCIDNSKDFKGYTDNIWGVTTSMGPLGYQSYGSSPGAAVYDGTVAPVAVVASLPFAPEIAMPALKFMYDNYGNKIYGFYGFKDAFNLEKKWFFENYIGINQGIILLMLENYSNQFVWKYFMKTKPVRNWLERCEIDVVSEE
jgi:hypothetical protein